MIKGLEVFKEFFRDYGEQYVLIGGAACDIVFNEANLPFRGTRDFDIVLIVEALTPEFGRQFWDFIKAGGYENRLKSSGAPQFYRFTKPKTIGFPFMIELFARAESVLDDGAYDCRPLHLGDEISSLSAILLNSDYYELLLKGKTVISDFTVLPHTYLILFKAKAWLDLAERKAQGQRIDSTDIKKHKNDITRLSALLNGDEVCVVPASVHADITQFIQEFEKEPPDVKAIGLSGVTYHDIAELLRKVFLTTP